MAATTYTAAQLLSPQSTALFDEFICLLDLSFEKDPMTNWLFKTCNHDEFLRKLTHYHRCLLRLALLSGARVIAIREEENGQNTRDVSLEKVGDRAQSKGKTSFKAMTILIPPSGSKKFESILTHLRAGLLTFAWNAGMSPMSRLLFEFMPKMKEMVSSMHPAPHQHRKYDQWHLLVLAARPDCQGQGLGRTLMLECQTVVKEAALESEALDEFVCPLSIEASTVGSKRLYSRMGFVDRGVMQYGVVKDGESVSTDEDGKVSGAKLFALTWTP